MSTPGNDALRQEIDSARMRVGNQVQASTALPATASVPLYVDSSNNLAAGTFPFSLPITQATATGPLLTLTGTGATDVMTNTLVVDGAGGGTTFTKKCYIRVNVTDTAAVVTSGNYYIQLGILT